MGKVQNLPIRAVPKQVSLVGLPEELQVTIFENLIPELAFGSQEGNKADLLALSATCKSFNRIVKPLLVRVWTYRTGGPLAECQFLEHLASNEPLWKKVYHLRCSFEIESYDYYRRSIDRLILGLRTMGPEMENFVSDKFGKWLRSTSRVWCHLRGSLSLALLFARTTALQSLDLKIAEAVDAVNLRDFLQARCATRDSEPVFWHNLRSLTLQFCEGKGIGGYKDPNEVYLQLMKEFFKFEGLHSLTISGIHRASWIPLPVSQNIHHLDIRYSIFTNRRICALLDSCSRLTSFAVCLPLEQPLEELYARMESRKAMLTSLSLGCGWYEGGFSSDARIWPKTMNLLSKLFNLTTFHISEILFVNLNPARDHQENLYRCLPKSLQTFGVLDYSSQALNPVRSSCYDELTQFIQSCNQSASSILSLQSLRLKNCQWNNTINTGPTGRQIRPHRILQSSILKDPSSAAEWNLFVALRSACANSGVRFEFEDSWFDGEGLEK